MSTLVNDLRAQFEPGDEVLVQRRKYGPRSPSVHRGRIRELRESMAVVNFPGRKGTSNEVIPYKRLIKVDVAPGARVAAHTRSTLRAVPPAFAALAADAPREEGERSELACTPPPLDAGAGAVHAVVRGSPFNREFGAWIEMGVALRDDMRDRVAALRSESAELADHAEQLIRMSDEKLFEAEAIEAQVREFDSIRAVASARRSG